MARPTSRAERMPSAATTMIMTRAMAVMMADCSEPSTSNIVVDSSSAKSMRTDFGQSFDVRDDVAHLPVGSTMIGADALDHFDGDRRLAVEPGITGRILEGAADIGDIRQRDDRSPDTLTGS